MSKRLLFQQHTARKWVWLWCAYWRLWPVLLRIKFKQFLDSNAWLRKKITLVHDQLSGSASNSLVAKQMHESVRLAARLHFLKAECLARSVVLADMLSVRGMDAKVVIGVTKQGEGLASHAWVELDGQIVAEPESIRQQFTALKY